MLFIQEIRLEESEEEGGGYSYNEQSLISRLTFTWIFSLLKRGYVSPLEMEDLSSSPPDESAKKQDEKLTKFREINSRFNHIFRVTVPKG